MSICLCLPCAGVKVYATTAWPLQLTSSLALHSNLQQGLLVRSQINYHLSAMSHSPFPSKYSHNQELIMQSNVSATEINFIKDELISSPSL